MLFVSYSRSERAQLHQVLAQLNRTSTGAWVDKDRIPVGAAFVEHIWAGLTACDAYLLLDSRAALRSYWVAHELKAATALRRSGHLRLLARLVDRHDVSDIGVEFDIVLDARDDWTTRLCSSLAESSHVSMSSIAPQSIPLLAQHHLGQPQHWTGRQHELFRLDEWWRSKSPGLWIHGAGGIGKSGLLQTWITVLRTLGSFTSSCSGVLYLRGADIASGMKLNDLTYVGSLRGALIALDGLDESKDLATCEALLFQALHEGARALAVSRDPPRHLSSCALETLELASLELASASALLENLPLLPNESAELIQLSQGHPHLLSLLRGLLQSGEFSGAELLERVRNKAGDA